MRVWTDRTPLTLHIAAGSPAALAVCGNRFANAAQEPGGACAAGLGRHRRSAAASVLGRDEAPPPRRLSARGH